MEEALLIFHENQRKESVNIIISFACFRKIKIGDDHVSLFKKF